MLIGVFDSGIGGKTVLSALKKRLPMVDFIYYGDTANIPYGAKKADEVREFSRFAVQFLIDRGAELIIIACNTASSAAGEFLRAEFNHIPIICMEPAINLACKQNAEGKRILVLATELTLKLEKYLSLKEQLKTELIDEIACPRLVDFAEEGDFASAEVRDYLEERLGHFNLEQYAFLVLGCTHFSYFYGVLEGILPPHIKIIDGNEGVTKRVLHVLEQMKKPLIKGADGGNGSSGSGGSIEEIFTRDLNYIHND